MKKLLLTLFIITGYSSNAQFWTPKFTGNTIASRGLTSFSIVDANVVWAKNYDGASTATPPPKVREYTKSIDGGNTWTTGTINLGTGNTTLNIASINAISANVAWVAAFKDAGTVQGIYKTTDGGATWTRQTTASFNTGTDSFPNFVYFFDANNGVCQGDPASGYFEIYTTVNGGSTWTRVPQANIPPPIFAGSVNDEFGYVTNFDVVGDTIWFGTSKGRLFKSSNKGLNWTVAQSPTPDFGSDSAVNGNSNGSYSFSDVNKGILIKTTGTLVGATVVQTSTLHTTTDGGLTWSPITASGYFRSDIEYIPGTSKIVSTGSGCSYSINDGVTWTNVDATQRPFVAFLSDIVGYASGFTNTPGPSTTGGVFKYTGNQLVNKTFESSKFSTYPNPVKDVLTILNTDNILFNEVTITDLNGRTIKNYKVNNLSETSLNVSELNAGVYFLSITSDSSKAVKKFIKN